MVHLKTLEIYVCERESEEEKSTFHKHSLSTMKAQAVAFFSCTKSRSYCLIFQGYIDSRQFYKTYMKGLSVEALTKSSYAQIFFKLWLQVENDKIRLKNYKKIRGHRTHFEDKAYHRP